MKTIHPAIAEHVMEENERLRGLLRELRQITSEYAWDADLEARVDAALSQQAEPAPAQDERDSVIAHIELCITNLKAEHQANPRVIAEVLYNIGYSRATRPAQTEQQPVVIPPMVEFDDMVNRLFELDADARKYCARHWLLSMWKATLNRVCELNAAPIAQTEQGDDQ